MVMPNELALQLHQLDVAVVEFADDLGTPVIAEAGEGLGEIHFAWFSQ
jgi:hypothetical protein